MMCWPTNYKSRPKYVKCEMQWGKTGYSSDHGEEVESAKRQLQPSASGSSICFFLLSHLPAASIPRAIIPMKLPQAAMQSININLRNVTCTSYYSITLSYLNNPNSPLTTFTRQQKNPSFGLRSQRACWRWCYLRDFAHCRFGGRIVNACVRLFFFTCLCASIAIHSRVER